MIVIPEEYDSLELSKHDKLLVNMLKNKLDSSSYILLKVNPVGENTVNVIIFPMGVCFLETMGIEDAYLAKTLISMFIGAKQKVEEKIYNRLLNHRYFNIKNGNAVFLKFPFSYKYYFPSISQSTMMDILSGEKERKFAEQCCLFSESRSVLSSNIEQYVKILCAYPSYPFSKDWSVFDDEGVNILIHLLAPEVTIPRFNQTKYNYVREEETVNYTTGKDYSLKPGELTVEVLRLEEDQINTINSINKGNQLILACAGSGKSVLLISKAFKVASLHPDKQFLITCKNRNLSNFYDWRINVAGFRNRNVRCSTFDKLCQDLLAEINTPFNMDDFDGTFFQAREALINGKIKRRFYGIFIDEIQIFKPEYYEFCYNLLENHNPNEHFLIICGDKSQDIVANIKQGKAPWQENPNLPQYTDNSIRIEKNYRNTIQINSFMDRFTQEAKVYFKRFGIDLESNEDLFLRGKAFREGPEPQIILTDRYNEATLVIEKVLELHEKRDIPLSEIAVLMYNKYYRPLNYYIFKWLKAELNRYYILHSELMATDESYGVLYGEREGVSLSTIHSALGLDFQAIIICGLYPLGSALRTKYKDTFNKPSNSETCKEDFYRNINTLYTACTRARDHLYIYLTEDEEKSLYSKILLDSIRGVGVK